MSQIRRSQFITTYGPGAILEGKNGPRIIRTVDLSRVFQGRHLTDFEITDQRLSQALLGGAGTVRLPSNAELGLPESREIYSTRRFPAWSLCTRHHVLYQKKIGDNKACPNCPPLDDDSQAWQQANRQSIRFVRTCPAGHLDDVDWVGIIQHTRAGCRPDYLLWKGSGALRNIQIECPLCHASVNLGVAYARNWSCSGRFPERESPGSGIYRPNDCQEDARIIQRGAANLRVAELQSALTIPNCDTKLHRLLEMTAVRATLFPAPAGKHDFLLRLSYLVQQRLISQAVADQIGAYAEDEILNAIQDVTGSVTPASPYSLRQSEFLALKGAATQGHPPVPPNKPGDPPQFEVNLGDVRVLPTRGNRFLRVTPVSRLRVTMVQTSYRRVPAGDIADTQPVDCGFEDSDGRRWYVGVEVSGEGIFLDLDTARHPENKLDLTGQIAATWLKAWQKPDDYAGRSLVMKDPNQYHPVFVWWHTLAHRLINALAVDSGYSSAAIRERIFIDVDPATGEVDGGLLLYTAQPGGDGTLGGLIALTPEFRRVLDRALYNLDTCSNDPLCGEERFGPQRYNGAACYACLLVSETSCEHRNMNLDRNLLLEHRP